MKKNYTSLALLLLFGVSYAQVGINAEKPTTTLEINGKKPATQVEGVIIPRFTGDEIYNMPIEATTLNDGNLVFATSAASTENQTGRGENLVGKGFYYWDHAKTKWMTMENATTNNYWAYVKPMNALLNDVDTYAYASNSSPGFVVPVATGLRLFDCNYTAAESNLQNPLNITMYDNVTKKIMIPQQLLGYSFTINISLKYAEQNSNASVTRIAAYTGDALLSGTPAEFPTSSTAVTYSSGGAKIKDVFFKISKTSGFTTVRDELFIGPIIVTQRMIDNGVYVFLGSGDNSTFKYFEPVLTLDYGVVNTSEEDEEEPEIP